MLNVPWYGWVNVVALVGLWLLYWAGKNMEPEKYSVFTATADHFKIAASVALIPLAFNPSIISEYHSAVLGLTMIVVPLVVWDVLGGLWEVVGPSASQEAAADQGNEPTLGPKSALSEALGAVPLARNPAMPSYAIDLDAGTPSSAENLKDLGTAVSQVFGSTSSDRERFQGTMKMLDVMAAGDHEEDDDAIDDATIDRWSAVIGVFMTIAVLVPPSYFTVQALLELR